METRLRKKEKDLSIALMLQKTLMSCYLCYQQGMQYLQYLMTKKYLPEEWRDNRKI